MDPLTIHKPTISNRIRLEMQSLSSFLQLQLIEVSKKGFSRTKVAAGTTRLRKIEFISFPDQSHSPGLPNDCQRLEDSILLRVRGNKYSSVAMAALKGVEHELSIEIHAEHEQGVALKIAIPVRYKRPGYLSIGESSSTETDARWFIEECPIYLDANS